jgi:hypothetical protein
MCINITEIWSTGHGSAWRQRVSCGRARWISSATMNWHTDTNFNAHIPFSRLQRRNAPGTYYYRTASWLTRKAKSPLDVTAEWYVNCLLDLSHSRLVLCPLSPPSPQTSHHLHLLTRLTTDMRFYAMPGLAEARGGVDPRLAPRASVEIGASAPPPPSRRRTTGQARPGPVDRPGPTGPAPPSSKSALLRLRLRLEGNRPDRSDDPGSGPAPGRRPTVRI